MTLNLVEATVKQAQFALIEASGYLVLVQMGVDGRLGIGVEEAPMDEVVEQIATDLEAKARRFYLVAQPKEMTAEEAEAAADAREAREWARFWVRTPEERAVEIQRRVQRIERMGQRAAQGGRGAGRMERRGNRMLTRLAQYSAQLSPERRRELRPLIEALGRALPQR